MRQGLTESNNRLVKKESIMMMTSNQLPENSSLSSLLSSRGFNENPYGDGVGFGLGLSVIMDPLSVGGASLSGNTNTNTITNTITVTNHSNFNINQYQYQSISISIPMSINTNTKTNTNTYTTTTGRGEFGWGGIASTFFFIDPSKDILCILMTQLIPSSIYPIRQQLRYLVHWLLSDNDIDDE